MAQRNVRKGGIDWPKTIQGFMVFRNKTNLKTNTEPPKDLKQQEMLYLFVIYT